MNAITIQPRVVAPPPHHPNFTMVVPRQGGVYYMRDRVMLQVMEGQTPSMGLAVFLLHHQAFAMASVEPAGHA